MTKRPVSLQRNGAALVAVTGTPGTGKKTVAPVVAKMLGLRLQSLNAPELLSSGRRTRTEVVVDPRRLRKKLLETGLKGALVYGHMVPDVLLRGEPDFVAVLRCDPSELKRRLVARGYPAGKVTENVEAELIGVILDASVRAYGASVVHEYDTTSTSPESIAASMAKDWESRTKRPARERAAWIDWTLDYDSSTKLRSLLSTPSTEPAST